jgi:glycosyltransferase involved in cell wall biosynthesis
VRIQLLGPLDVNPTAITKKEIEHWDKEGIIEYLGETKDVRPYIAEASVFVLPSYYREGTPRSVLEAMSMGRPIITTDAPGCRETVQEGVNGYLVPVKDHIALKKAMERFVLQPELIPVFGLASRRIAEEKYDVNKVNRIILEEMGLL